MRKNNSARHEQIAFLVRYFLDEPSGAVKRLGIDRSEITEKALQDASDDELFNLFRSLVNVRPVFPAPDEILAAQDAFLKSEIARKGITDSNDLHGVSLSPANENAPELIVWQGDITTLKVDAIVNAANSALLGCWAPCHACIDNAIHTFAGMQLRAACQRVMDEQGHEEETGQAKITSAFNLPSKYVLHTVGPIIHGELTSHDERLLAACYESCLSLAEKKRCASIAFCCISTGEFHFPNRRAAEIAVETVSRHSADHRTTTIKKVVFNVFKDIDLEIYTRLIHQESL